MPSVCICDFEETARYASITIEARRSMVIMYSPVTQAAAAYLSRKQADKKFPDAHCNMSAQI
jgi:hypothetical protein